MRRTVIAVLFCLATGASLAWAGPSSPVPEPAADSPSDVVDDVILGEMRKRHVAGLSLAIIQDGKIVKAKGYGVTEQGGDSPVTTATLFQAGSISKSVSALGALRLVEQGKLALDEDVNARLVTWKVPVNEFTREKKVTLRGLLSHTAGLTVHGFPGYATDDPVPTVVQILDGAKPANTKPIRVDFVPGSKWRYSGGGYTVMQQMIVDVTGKPFPQFMQEAVLGPLAMKESTFEQPLPAGTAKLTASGYYGDRSPVKGRWHIYPEMAAAGLWTTPSDLARFAIGVQEAARGQVRPSAVAADGAADAHGSEGPRRAGGLSGGERPDAAVRPRRPRQRVRRPVDRLRGDRPGRRDHDQRQRQLPDDLPDPRGHRQGVPLARLPRVDALEARGGGSRRRAGSPPARGATSSPTTR